MDKEYIKLKCKKAVQDTDLHKTYHLLIINEWYYVIIDHNFVFIYNNANCSRLQFMIPKEELYEYFYKVNEIRKIKINSLFN